MKLYKNRKILTTISSLILFSFFIVSFMGIYNLDSNDVSEKINLKQSSYSFGDKFFNGTGSQLNVSLLGNRSLKEEVSIQDKNLIISNTNSGWNISKFKLNFSDIKAEQEYVKYETRNDDSIGFNTINKFFAMSFKIPNNCLLKNISLFLQYPGGTGSSFNSFNSEFIITVYNSTINAGKIEPDLPIHEVDDEINFDLTSKNVTQPAKWYESNFKDRKLNTSKTTNNTFFAVFQSKEFPSSVFGSPDGYMYFADEEESDKYNITFYEKSGISATWDLINQKNGMFKVNLAPLNTISKPQEINLTVFNRPVNNDGIYINKTLFPNQDNKFTIPINSPWFGDVNVNVSFEGKFQYNTKSTNIFKVVNGSDVFWNSSLEINEFNEDFYNKTAKFYKPEFWSYEKAFNNSELFKDVIIQVEFIQLYDISNSAWKISYSQKNNIISPNFLSSSDKKEWESFSNQEFINARNYINISATFNNSNGDVLLYVYTGTSQKKDLVIQQKLTNQLHSFPLWRPRYNTSILKNDTLIELRIMTNNGTMAGINSNTFRVLLYKNQTVLELTSSLKNSYVYGDKIDIESILLSNQNPLIRELIHFKIIETYSGGITNEIILNDTTDDDGIAKVSYSVKQEIRSIQISASYNGSLDYETSEFSTAVLIIRSPFEQFFLDFLPILIIIIGVIVSIVGYYVIKRYKFKKNMELWQKKTQFFADVLKIDMILVIHKESGSALIQRSFSDIPVDGNLISGFLQAVSSFKYEIKQEVEKTDKESILLDYQDYNILLRDGKFVRVALILNSEPSANLRSSLKEFIKDFEKKAFDDLKAFVGNVSPFREYFMDLVNKYFEISFIRPHIINENPPSISLNSFQKRIMAIAENLQRDANQFYISQLLNYLISAQPDEPKERFIANIYDLRESGFIEPL